ncbi:FMN phosphatase YigB (HAD superfamily) [Luteibacter sp. Sphag1AF]|uniref:HAD family hydrolase n=1 Tax=Luteibacter sp. Sphag1AF TaxID=2587031 RepID=UPI001608AD8B|nr:FMN phosphatase YigB (HAD superfamily) [Luteibacter sp. Sphag1AF]
MSNTHKLVFLLDIDNTLLDNDRFGADLYARLERDFGTEGRDAYNAIDRELRKTYGFADYLTTLQRLRIGRETQPGFSGMSFFLLDYPFDERVFPGTFEVLDHLKTLGQPVILSDGDAVFQPRKARRAGLWDALDGHVLIYVHKEDMLDDVFARYPADHYVMVDDKPRILVALKQAMGDRVTTVFVRQGHYAAAAGAELEHTPPDITVDSIAELRHFGAEAFLPGRVA